VRYTWTFLEDRSTGLSSQTQISSSPRRHESAHMAEVRWRRIDRQRRRLEGLRDSDRSSSRGTVGKTGLPLLEGAHQAALGLARLQNPEDALNRLNRFGFPAIGFQAGQVGLDNAGPPGFENVRLARLQQ